MPIVKVFGLPEDMNEMDMDRLQWNICNATASVKELNITKDQVIVFFPSGLIKDLGGKQQVVVEVDLFAKRKRNDKVLGQLAEKLGRTVKKELDRPSLVECLVKPFPEKRFWRSG